MRKRIALVAAAVLTLLLGVWVGVAYAADTNTPLQSKSISVNTYMVMHSDVINSNANDYQSTAVCPQSYTVTGGGGMATSNTGAFRDLKASLPTDIDRWSVRFDVNTADTVYVWALCINVS